MSFSSCSELSLPPGQGGAEYSFNEVVQGRIRSENTMASELKALPRPDPGRV